MAKRIIGSTPKADGYRMPAEFEPQDGVWMLWPERNDNWRSGAKPAQETFCQVAWSDVFSAAPANHRALCSGGSFSMRMVNQFLPRTPDGASSSCTSLNTDTMCRRSCFPSGGRNSASRSTTEVSKPSAAS